MTDPNHDRDQNRDDKGHQHPARYLRFLAMIATSMAFMYAVMYLHTYRWSHVWYSETRLYMTLLMGATMGVVMLAFMLHMYKDKKKNLAIVAGSVLLFVAAVFLVRSQTLVGEVSYMKGMIPHHSIAILTSERSQIEDVRVQELADGIIKAQRKEIKEMEWLIEDIRDNGPATSEAEAAERPLPKFEGSLSPADGPNAPDGPLG